MLIAFAHAWDGPHVEYFLKTVQGHELWQITDQHTPDLPNVNVFRHPRQEGEGFVLWRARAYAAFGKTGIYLDTDIFVNHDLAPVMALDFDICLTKTKAIVKDPNGTNLTDIMPYNGGVMFIKNTKFLNDVADWLENQDEHLQKWYGDQFALAEVSKKYNMVELPNTIYNYKPKKKDLDTCTLPKDKWIIHFKGQLKDQMCKSFQYL